MVGTNDDSLLGGSSMQSRGSSQAPSLSDYFGTSTIGTAGVSNAPVSAGSTLGNAYLSSLGAATPGSRSEIQQLMLQQQLAQLTGASNAPAPGPMSSSFATLLAQQHLQQLQQNPSASLLGLRGSGAIDGDRLNALALLQQRQQEQDLSERLRLQQQNQDMMLLNERLFSPSRSVSGMGTQSQLSRQEALMQALATSGNGNLGLGPGAEGLRDLDRLQRLATLQSMAQGGGTNETNAVAMGREDTDKSIEKVAKESSGGESVAKSESSLANEKGRDAEKKESDADEDEEGDDDSSAESSDTFPFKLYRMLAEAEEENNEDIVSFDAKGKCFMIHKPREFVTDIMPKYFTTSRMSSFQRQLNLYGFRRLSEGPDKGGYSHEYFVKGRKNLCKKIKRKKPTLKLPPQGLGYLGQSMFGGASALTAHGGGSSALSVRQMIADGQLAASGGLAAGIPGQQHSSFFNQGSLVSSLGAGAFGGAGGSPSLAHALLAEQQARQQQQDQMLQQLIMRQKQESDLQLLEEHRRRLDQLNRR